MRTILMLSAVLLITSFAQASITGFNCQDDGDGGIIMNPATLAHDQVLDEYTLSMSGKQYFAPAHMEGDIFATPEDPTVWMVESVDNYTGFSWTGYEFYIGMDKTFNILNAIAPTGWTYAITAPVNGLPLPNHSTNTGWVGKISFTASNPSYAIAPLATADFGAKVSFIGSVAFCTAQIPTPEPATMAILGLGSMALLRRRKTA